jgi:hypothetical protein
VLNLQKDNKQQVQTINELKVQLDKMQDKLFAKIIEIRKKDSLQSKNSLQKELECIQED